jgi:hypothetical protein
MRVCHLARPQAELIGARYVSANQLRSAEKAYVDPRLKKLGRRNQLDLRRSKRIFAPWPQDLNLEVSL